ncbi:MAG: class I SAM-dependent methyltransferase [Porphyrobacter sp.]|nr:class I SAM-dependent methyltransferase [Porphyrobacter sp.]
MMDQAVQDVPDVNADGYKNKQSTYFGGVRRDFLALLPKDGSANVLELGCGSGETGAAAIAQGLCQSYTGVELAPQAAAMARTRLTEVFEGDVERMTFPWPDGHFDAVLMSEVLEHLIDPWTVVKRVAAKLKPGAIVLASSPNVAQLAILKGIIADRWELTETGVMDRTHLRWFTQGSYRQMFEDAGIRIDQVRAMAPPGPFGSVFNLVTMNRFRHLTMRQICVVGHKP